MRLCWAWCRTPTQPRCACVAVAAGTDKHSAHCSRASQDKAGSKRKQAGGGTRQRLAKKLLGHRGVNAAFTEVSGVEGDVAREREENRWADQ